MTGLTVALSHTTDAGPHGVTTSFEVLGRPVVLGEYGPTVSVHTTVRGRVRCEFSGVAIPDMAEVAALVASQLGYGAQLDLFGGAL